MTDPTRTRISASAMERIRNCPASVKRSEGLQSKSSPESESGDEIHDYIRWHWLHTGNEMVVRALTQTEEPQPLIDDDQFKDAESMIEKTIEVTRAIEAECSVSGSLEWRVKFCEERLFLGVQTLDGVEKISGVPDVVFVNDECNTAVIVDYKSGWGRYDSKSNEQLATLAVLVDYHVKVEQIYVVIVKPTGKPEVAVYDKKAIRSAQKNLVNIVCDAIDPRTPFFHPGKWCQYCPAMQNAACPEAISAGLEVAEKAQGEAGVKTREEITTDVRRLTNDQLAAAAKRLKLAQVVCEVIKEEAKARLKAGEKVPGCSLKEGRKMRSIPDVLDAWRATTQKSDQAVQSFWDAVELSPSKFEKAMTSREVPKPDRKRILEECGMVETRAEESLEVES